MTRLSLRIKRSPGRRISGKLRKKLSWQVPVARSKTSMRLEPRIAGGDSAISSSGRSKLKSDTRKTGQFWMVICGVLDGETWCGCGRLCGRLMPSKIFLFSQLYFHRLSQFDGTVQRG